MSVGKPLLVSHEAAYSQIVLLLQWASCLDPANVHGSSDDWLLALPCIADRPTSLELFDDVMTTTVLIKSTHKARKETRFTIRTKLKKTKGALKTYTSCDWLTLVFVGLAFFLDADGRSFWGFGWLAVIRWLPFPLFAAARGGLLSGGLVSREWTSERDRCWRPPFCLCCMFYFSN